MKEITIRRPIIWKSLQDTNIGMVREANEDSVLSNAKHLCWAVADGIGGYEGGSVASQLVVAALESLTADISLSQLVDDIEDRQLGDVFLLCSDGLYNMVSEDEISTALGPPLEQAIGSLMWQALEHGADDDISLILVKIEPGSRQGPATSAAES